MARTATRNLFPSVISRSPCTRGCVDPATDKPKDRHHLTVVGATSGDTGSAAIYGLRGKKDVSVFILHPKGRVSPIQEAQMTTVLDANVHNIAVHGTFDDCQVCPQCRRCAQECTDPMNRTSSRPSSPTPT